MKLSGPARSVSMSLLASLTIGGIVLVLVALTGANVAPAMRGISMGLIATGAVGLMTLAFYHFNRKYSMPGLYWLAAGLATAIGLIILLISISRA